MATTYTKIDTSNENILPFPKIISRRRPHPRQNDENIPEPLKILLWNLSNNNGLSNFAVTWLCEQLALCYQFLLALKTFVWFLSNHSKIFLVWKGLTFIVVKITGHALMELPNIIYSNNTDQYKSSVSFETIHLEIIIYTMNPIYLFLILFRGFFLTFFTIIYPQSK